MLSSPTVFLIDDQDAFCDATVKLVSSIGLTAIVYTSGIDFLQKLDVHRPGCVVIDLGKPHLDGMRVLDELARLPQAPPAIVLTGNADVASVVRAAHHGVFTYLQKQLAGRTEILDAIQAGIKLDAQRRANQRRLAEIHALFQTLTDDERRVLDLLLVGEEIVIIAKKLQVSRRTIENRRSKLMKKLSVHNFVGLVALANELGQFGSPKTISER